MTNNSNSMSSMLLWVALMLFANTLFALNETEPNGTFATANNIPQDSTMNGSCTSTDNDYFYSVPGDDGTIKVDYSYTGSSAGDDIYVYVYNKGGGLIGSQSHVNVGTSLQNDSLFVFCRQQDTIYFRFSASGSFSYSFQYTTIPSGTSDVEPNDAFTSAQFTNSSDTTRGRIGYTSTATDGNDYFETALPIYGTFKLYIDYINTSNSTGSDIYFYVYNKSGGLIGSSSKVNQPLGASQDSVIVYCREQDTIFIRIAASGCFSYQFYYQVDAPTTNDAEPNNDFASAQPVSSTSATGGRIGYTSVQTDQNDYFLAALPTFGTLNFYLQYDNTSNSTGSDIYAYIYNKGGGLIGSSSLVNQPLGVGFDTITVNCRELDTVYFRISSSGCFSYSFTYDVFAPTTNDVEPNNNFSDAKPFSANDTLGGRIGYISTGADPNDYFYSLLPEDGTIKYFIKYFNTSGSTGSDLYSYIYNEGGGLIGSSSKINQPLGLGTDSITVNCRAQDTVYFRITSSGCFSYKIYYEMDVPTPSDSSGNDAFATAQAVSFSDTTYGRVGYTSVSTDQNDYYLTVLPDDGTLEYIVEYTNTSGSTGSDYYSYIYNKGGGLIGSSSKVNQALGAHVDTILVHCRAADTVYLRTTSSGCFSYKFYQNILVSGTADVEPNNTLATANPILLSNTLNGRIGYTGTQADPNDYFTFNLPEYSNITAYLTFNNTSNSTGADFYVYLYNSGGGLVFSNSYFNNQLGITTDTLNMNCLPGGAYTIRTTSSGCFSYSFDFEVENQQPNANIRYSRYGNQLAFMSEVGVNDSVYWDFDDGTNSSLFLPKKEFGIGVFDVVLNSFNTSCNIIASDTAQVTVNGIEYYTPANAGTYDFIGYFNMRIFGGGLDTLAVVELSQGGNVVKPFSINSPDGSELNVLFNFNQFSAFGLYDLTIKLSSGDTYTFPDGFEIFQDQPGFNITTSVNGPETVRTNRWTNYELIVENDRARIANGVMAFIVIPRSVDTDIFGLYEKQTGVFRLKGAEWDKIEIDRDDLNRSYFLGEFNPLTDTSVINFDSLYYAMDSLDPGIEIDTLYGEYLPSKVYPIYIPFIAGRSSAKLKFRLKNNQNSNNSYVISFVWPFTFRDNPPSGEALGYIHDAGMTAGVVAGNSPHPALKVVGKSVGAVDVLSKAAFTKAFDLINDQNNYDELNAVDIPGINTTDDKTRQKINQEQHQRMKEELRRGKILEDAYEDGELPENLEDLLLDRIDDYIEEVDELGPNATDEQKRAALDKLKKHLDGRNIDLTNDELDDLVNPKEAKTTKPKERKRKRVRSVTSTDPNAIYGNDGPTVYNFIRKKDQLNYLVTFENVDTALAPAQIVKINLQLDTTVFDVSSTTLGNITIAGTTYDFEPDRSQYFTNIDLRPDKQIIVRVNANIDTLTGFIEWQFTSLEPATGELLNDPLDGFLPPNVNFPEGEGSVSFSTFLKEKVADQDSIGALALIYFDENEPILTNTYINYIDENNPVSSLNPSINVINDTIMELNYSGTDAGSGLMEYFLKAKVNNDEWLGVDYPLDGSGTTTVTGSQGNTYSFYIISQDSVGNREQKPEIAEAEVSLGTTESDFNPSFTVYPNPNQGDLLVKSNGNFQDVEVVIYSVTGQVAYVATRSFSAGIEEAFTLPKLKQGAYLVHFTNKAGNRNVQKLLIVIPD